jgi:hypothetical protein
MIPSERNSGELNRRFLTPTFDPEVLKKPISRREANIRAHPAQPGKKNKKPTPKPGEGQVHPTASSGYPRRPERQRVSILGPPQSTPHVPFWN